MGNYLQIPVGAGYMQSFDFDLDRFQTLFNLPGWPLVGALLLAPQRRAFDRDDIRPL
jgi:hypothetical protein